MINYVSLSFRGSKATEESYNRLIFHETRFLAEPAPSGKTRFLAEFILSRKTRFFALLRMTCEGLGMTNEGLEMTKQKNKSEVSQSSKSEIVNHHTFTDVASPVTGFA